MEEVTNLLSRWQELTGAALGPFLAVMLSAIGFGIKLILDNRREHKEYLRRVEVSVTVALNDTYAARGQLMKLAGMIRELSDQAKAVKGDKIFFLERINFPTTQKIYRNSEIPKFKIRSYYLHNKLLFVDRGIIEVNETLADLKNDFEALVRFNMELIALMGNNPKPAEQRVSYAKSLESFAAALEIYASKKITGGIRALIQIKVYNNKIRKRHGYITWWKYEGVSLKYFKNRNIQKEFANNIGSLDRIDALLSDEVESTIEKIEKQLEAT